MKKYIAIVLGIIGIVLVLNLPVLNIENPTFVKTSDGRSFELGGKSTFTLSGLIGRFVYRGEFTRTAEVNLKTFPFGHVNATWNNLRPGEVRLHIKWRTDVGKGAGNIWIGYSLDSGKSFIEFGPYGESSEIKELTIPIKLSDKKLIARWRGEDLDKKDAAFGYVQFELYV